jgi:threonine/homoserine/homoserine lactone efflux protein
MLHALLLGFIIGLTGALVPGPTLVVTITSALKRGWKEGPKVFIGHGILEAAIFPVIILGLGTQIVVQDYSFLIAGFGGTALIIFGLMTFWGPKEIDTNPTATGNFDNPFFAGIITSAANPYFWIWWLSIGCVFILTQLEIGLLNAVVFLIGHWIADLGWLTVVSISIHRGRSVLSDRAYSRTISLCGIFLVAFGIYFFTGLFGL